MYKIFQNQGSPSRLTAATVYCCHMECELLLSPVAALLLLPVTNKLAARNLLTTASGLLPATRDLLLAARDLLSAAIANDDQQ